MLRSLISRGLVVMLVGCALAAGGQPQAIRSAVTPAATGSISLRGSVGQVIVEGAPVAVGVSLLDQRQKVIDQGTTDAIGAYLFRKVPPGRGYTVTVTNDPTLAAGPVRVTAIDDHPPESFYKSQKLKSGYQYITTRDGTLLAANITLPGPIEDGPYPTVIEYSGYDPANPEDAQPTSQLAQTIDYAVVGVNVRGSGCSGGAWSFFDETQQADGYDIVETVASQSWVLHNRVGMVGISYPGISQLFVAATQPPHLAAITPLSVIGDVWADALYPGGILNSGFVVPWADDRQDDARPAPEGGQGWAKRRVKAGDQVCAANQGLRRQTLDVRAQIDMDKFYSPERMGVISPREFAEKITVPVFLAGAWQDEQTGAGWPELIPGLLGRVPLKVTMTNGTHSDSLGPDVITRWAEFLDFYVAKKVPKISITARITAAIGYARLTGALIELPPDRFNSDTSFKTALRRYEAEMPIRVLFDSGGGPVTGAPQSVFEASFDQWPPKKTVATDFFFQPTGKMARNKTKKSGTDSFKYDPAALPATSHPSTEDDYFDALPDYDWSPLAPDQGVGYLSPPFAKSTVLLGPVSADLWLKSSQPDVDLEVVLTEVRKDGTEIYLQSGWLRASRRKLNQKSSTRLQPKPTFTEADAKELPANKFSLVRVPVFSVGHALRIGSRLRVIVQPPGGNRPRWAFAALPGSPRATVTVDYSRRHPSRIVLPLVSNVKIVKELPVCPGLRGQPCRKFIATATGG